MLPETRRRMVALIRSLVKAAKISADSLIYFVDDGSRDRTWPLLEQFALEDRHVVGVKLSRNRGHQNALLAGLFTAEGDAVVTIDADLQDDISAISEMVDRFIGGAEVVYGVRRKRDSDSLFKRLTAELFYSAINVMGQNRSITMRITA